MATDARPIVAVDLDEVLGKFLQQFSLYYNERFGTSVTEDDFFSYHFSDVLGGTAHEMNLVVLDFFKSKHFTHDFPVLPDARAELEALRPYFRFVIVTSRQTILEELTREWVELHYPGLFERIVLGNHYGLSGEKKTKKELCLELGAVALVDDSVKYVAEVSDSLKLAVLFGNYAWNKCDDAELPANVRRVPDWRHAADELRLLLPAPEGDLELHANATPRYIEHRIKQRLGSPGSAAAPVRIRGAPEQLDAVRAVCSAHTDFTVDESDEGSVGVRRA